MTEHRTRIDDAIDRAVRDMMRHDPPAGFRRRVLSRLNAPVRRQFLWAGLATAAAAVAIIALANVVTRDVPQGPAGKPPDVMARVPVNPPGPPAPPVSAAQPRIDAPSPGPAGRRAPRREPVRTATFGPRDERVSATSVRERSAPVETAADELVVQDSIALPPPITVAPLPRLPPLEIAPIVVAPIQIPRVQLAPLSPPR